MNLANVGVVTREEAVWESFSEDEPVPPKPKVSTPVQSVKGKKGGAKPGQGNIMSFFGKK
jgi:DNA polymerase delta subunit 3